MLYDNYLLTVPRESQVRHLHFIRDHDRDGTAIATTITTQDFEEITEITLLAPDHPRLLSTITGCCAAAGANIVDAQIFTTKDGRALDSIFITRAFDADVDERRRAQGIAKSIEDVLSGKARLNNLLASRQPPTKRIKAFSVEPQVRIDNDLSDHFTVIETEGLDRLGVLSEMTDALADLLLDIASAQIATFGEKFIDTFYVTDLVGHKIKSPQKLFAVKRKLLAVLGGESRHASAEPGTKRPKKKAAA